MIRHENHFLLLIHQHEIFDVLPSSFKFIVTERQEGLMHVVWICHRDLRDFLSFDDKAHMERKKADDRKIEPPSEEHLKDVIKPQEEHFRRRRVDVAHAKRYTHRIKWISWILRREKAFLCRQYMVVQSPEIPGYALHRFWREDRLARDMDQ